MSRNEKELLEQVRKRRTIYNRVKAHREKREGQDRLLTSSIEAQDFTPETSRPERRQHTEQPDATATPGSSARARRTSSNQRAAGQGAMLGELFGAPTPKRNVSVPQEEAPGPRTDLLDQPADASRTTRRLRRVVEGMTTTGEPETAGPRFREERPDAAQFVGRSRPEEQEPSISSRPTPVNAPETTDDLEGDINQLLGDEQRRQLERIRNRKPVQFGEGSQPSIGPASERSRTEFRNDRSIREQAEEQAARMELALPGSRLAGAFGMGAKRVPIAGIMVEGLHNLARREGGITAEQFMELYEASGPEVATRFAAELAGYGAEIYGVGRVVGALGRRMPGPLGEALAAFDPRAMTSGRGAVVTEALAGAPSDIVGGIRNDDPSQLPVGMLAGAALGPAFRRKGTPDEIEASRIEELLFEGVQDAERRTPLVRGQGAREEELGRAGLSDPQGRIRAAARGEPTPVSRETPQVEPEPAPEAPRTDPDDSRGGEGLEEPQGPSEPIDAFDERWEARARADGQRRGVPEAEIEAQLEERRRLVEDMDQFETAGEYVDAQQREIQEKVAQRRAAREAAAQPSPEDAPSWARRVETDPEAVRPRATGARQRTVFPGSNEKIETEIQLVPRQELRASHTPDYTKRPAEEFPTEAQGRAYHGEQGRQARADTEEIKAAYDIERALDPTVLASEGLPVVTRDLVAVAGNGRIMVQQGLPPAKLSELHEGLVRNAERLGMSPDDVRAALDAEDLVPVRVIVDPNVPRHDIDRLRGLNKNSDVPTAKANDAVSDASSRAQQLRSAEGALRHFADTIGDDQSLRAYLETKGGGDFLRKLVDDGVIAPRERARFMNAAGEATPEGKQLVERMMYAAAIGDPDVMSRAPAAVLRKMDTALPAIIRASRVEGWDMGPELRDALDLLASARAQDMKLDDLVAQVDIARPAPDPGVVQLARFLEGAPKNSRGNLVGVKEAFRSYADDAEAFARLTESEDLFGHEPRTRTEAQQQFAALSPFDWARGRKSGQPFQELTREERLAYAARHHARMDEMLAFEKQHSRDMHFGRDRVLMARSPEEMLRAVNADPRVAEARKSPQPGSGRDTWAIHIPEARRGELEEALRNGDSERLAQLGMEATPERWKVRDKVLGSLEDNAGWASPERRQFDGPVARDKKFVFVLGPPAAGKSTAANEYIQSLRARVIDSDEAKRLLPEYDEGRGAGMVHEESSHLAGDVLLDRALDRGENIVYPTIGKKRAEIQGRIEALQAAGYEVHVVINEVPIMEAARRAWTRFLKTGRWVDLEYILGVGDKPSRTFHAVKRHPAVTSYRRYDNNVPIDKPAIIREAEGEFPGLRRDHGQARRPSDSAAPEAAAGEGSTRPLTPGGAEGRGVAQASELVDGSRHPLVAPDEDLFGNAVHSGPDQGDLGLGVRKGPQGMSTALEDARTTVSSLEGKIARGDATASEVTRYEEARALIRRSEGKGLDEGETSARAREAARPQQPGDTRDLFNPLAPAAQAGERLPSASRFARDPSGLEPKSPTTIVRELNEAVSSVFEGLGLKVATGKLPKGGIFNRALGVFKGKEHVIRQIDISDVPVFGHEAGHAMHKLFFGSTPKGKLRNEDLEQLGGAIRGELEDLSKGISTEDLVEGWAEAWRRYLDNPDALAREAPNTLRWIEQKLVDFPTVKAAWMNARADWLVYREAGARARVRSKVSIGDRGENVLSIGDRWSRLRTAVFDDFEPIRRIVQKIRDEVGVESIAEEADTLARLSRGSVGVANHFLEHGVLDFRTLKKVGPSLKAALEPVLEEIDAFREYMVARRAVELHDRDILTGFRNEDVRAVIDELEAGELGDAMKKAFDDMQEWNRGLLAYLRDSGVISKDSFDAILELNQSYVPFYRVQRGEKLGGLGETFGHLFSPVKRIKGSGEDVIDPLESLVKNALTYTQIAQKQQVSRALAALADKPGVGPVLEKLGTPIKRSQFQLGEIEGKLTDIVPGLDELLEGQRAKAQLEFERLTAGMTPEEISRAGLRPHDPAEEVLAVFRPGDYMGKPNMISVLKDGKRVWYEIDDELYKALEGLNKEQLDAFARFMGKPARTLRAGATLAPEFLIRNPLRDQVMAFVQSEYGYTPFVDMARGTFELMRKGEAYQQWISSGGYRAALTSLDRKSMQTSLRRLLDEGGVENVIKHPLDAIQAMSAIMEDATRMGEFMNARAVEGTSKEGLQRAASASREISVDFARHGAKTAFLRHTSAFWNARLQGYDRLAREAKTNPARFQAKAFAAITVPSLLEYYINFDNPDYWETPQWRRDLFWMIPNPLGDGFISIPKPFELGLIYGTLPVRIMDNYLGGHGGAAEMREFFTEALVKGEVGGFLPAPQAIMPIYENLVNYSFFLGRRIVPRGEENVRPEYQGGAYTSEVAKMLGRWAPGDGVSPRKIDNLLYAWTGGLGRLATQATDPLLEGRIPFTDGEVPPIGRKPSELPGIRGVTAQVPGFSSESIERFYETYNEAITAVSTMRFLERSGNEEGMEKELTDAEATRLRGMEPALRNAAGELAELRAALEQIRRDPDMSSAEKRAEADELGLRARAIAQAVLGRNLPDGG